MGTRQKEEKKTRSAEKGEAWKIAFYGYSLKVYSLSYVQASVDVHFHERSIVIGRP